MGDKKVASLGLPWVEKYRPKTAEELVSIDHISNTIDKFIEADQFPHLLFYGPPGTGKTSLCLAVARKLYGSNVSSMTLELNASDDRGIDVVRNQIKDFASTQQLFSSGFKLVVLDEADAMTSAAQFALRRIIEKYSKNTRFCIICNFVSKIIPALQSRCTAFRFKPLVEDEMRKSLAQVVLQEKLDVTEDAVSAVLRLAEGDMRKALNVLQSASMAFETITEDNIYGITGQPHPRDMENLVKVLFAESYNFCLRALSEVQTLKGLSLVDIVREVHNFVILGRIPPLSKAFLLENLAEIEYRMNRGSSERVQSGALVSIFVMARKIAADNPTRPEAS